MILAVTRGERPPWPEKESCKIQGKLDNEIWETIERCWSQSPVRRPTVTEVVDRLRGKLGLQSSSRQQPSQADHTHSFRLFSEDYSTGFAVDDSTASSKTLTPGSSSTVDASRTAAASTPFGMIVPQSQPISNGAGPVTSKSAPINMVIWHNPSVVKKYMLLHRVKKRNMYAVVSPAVW